MAKNLISQHNFTLTLLNSSLASSVIDSTAKLLILKIPIFKKHQFSLRCFPYFSHSFIRKMKIQKVINKGIFSVKSKHLLSDSLHFTDFYFR